MYKCVILPLSLSDIKSNCHTAFRVREESHSHMNHTQETGMEVKGRSDRLLALDGTERTKKHKVQSRYTQLRTAHNLKVTGAAPVQVRQQPPRHCRSQRTLHVITESLNDVIISQNCIYIYIRLFTAGL